MIYLHWKVLLIVRQVPSLLQGLGKFGGHWPKTAQPVNPSKTGFILKLEIISSGTCPGAFFSASSGEKSLYIFSSIFSCFSNLLFCVFFSVWVNLGKLVFGSRAPPRPE